MTSPELRATAVLLLSRGVSLRDISRVTGVATSTLHRWRGSRIWETGLWQPWGRGAPLRTGDTCPRCATPVDLPVDRMAYLYLLGLYLGDGHIAPAGKRTGSFVLRVYCDDKYPALIEAAELAMRSVLPASVFRTRRNVNWTERTVAGERRRYSYPRYFFTNASDDIRRICTDALDQLGVEWRQSNARNISVARRASVAILDEFIGPKQ